MGGRQCILSMTVILIYIGSDPTKRHSGEIEDNSKVAGTFGLPQTDGEKVRGVRFEGEARQLKGEENDNRVMIYKHGFGWWRTVQKRLTDRLLIIVIRYDLRSIICLMK